MKTYMIIIVSLLLSFTSCQSQDKTEKAISKEDDKKEAEQPKGSWKVDKQFDEDGNLVRYDSIYSWSSDNALNDLTSLDKDSLLNNFESKFYRNFSQFKSQGFENIFKQDSLFSKSFFNDNFFESDFGEEFMELDHMRKRMIERQKKFLEKYRSDFGIKENDSL